MSMVLPVTLNAPGQWGVNEQEQDQLLHPNWATVADSLVLNDSGRLQCRGALTLVSTDGAPTEILRQFVYVTAAGVETVIHTTATKIISGITDLDDATTDITSSTVPTNGFWKFANFNGKVVGWQAGHTPIVWSGSGDFADITVSDGGTLPDGDAMVAAFGRVWASDDDGQTIRYSGLLDETQWAVASGAGSIDMRNVWTNGTDRVVALAAHGANLIVFGRKHIVFYTDGQGSALGVDPDQMYVVDTIEGTGCAARDSVVSIAEGDLVFLSEVGVQSLRRLVINKDNPLVSISWQIADRLATAIKAEIVSATDLRTWTGHYIPETSQYMLVDTTNEDVYAFHMGGRTQDEKGRELIPITIWDTSVLTNIRGFITLRTGVTYTSGSATHELYKYDTAVSLDQGSTAIAVDYESGWIKTEQSQYDEIQKTLKFATLTLSNEAGINSAITFKYGTDYKDSLDSMAAVAADEKRIINIYDTMGDIEGQHFKFGMTDTSFGLKVLQQFSVYMSPGRTAMTHAKIGQGFTDTSVSGPQILAVGASDSEVVTGTTQTFSMPISSEADGALILVSVGSASYAGTISVNYGDTGDNTLLDVGGFSATFGLQGGLVVFSGSPSSANLVITGSVSFAGKTVTAQIIPLKGITGSSAVVEDYASVVDSNDASVSLPASATIHKSQLLVVMRRSSYLDSDGTDYDQTETDESPPQSPVFEVTAVSSSPTSVPPSFQFVTSFDFTYLSVVSRVLIFAWEDVQGTLTYTWTATQKNIGTSGTNELYATLYRPT